MITFQPGVVAKDHRPRLFAEDYMAASWLHRVYFSDYSQAEFPMYANDRAGDCTFAGLGHLIGAWTFYGKGKEALFTDDQILKTYSSLTGYNPITGANDNGAQLADVLNFGHKTGIGGHKIDAWAEIRDLSVAGLSKALSLFGGVYCAVQLPQSAEDQFNSGLPWTVVGDRPVGGHCITLQRVLRGGKASLGFATWGAVQPATQAWWHTYGFEAYAVYSRDFMRANGQSPAGLDEATLLADMKSLNN